MAQFDVYVNRDARGSARTPYLLDIQSDILSSLATRLVVPLRPRTHADKPLIRGLHPEIVLGEAPFKAVVSEMAALPSASLGSRVGTLLAFRQEILDACDLILTGF